jgi:glycerate dehydrogenase
MKFVVLDGYALNPGDLSWEGIALQGDLQVFDRTSAQDVPERAKGAAVVFTNKTPITKEALDQLPDLKYIGVLATGYNIVDVEAAKKRGIIVSNIPSYGTSSVAQLTFALLLELCHQVQRHSDSVHDGKWARAQDWCFWDYPLTELEGKTIGIIGFGTIGQKVADIATAFGMDVVGTSRNRSDQSHRKNFRWVGIPELLSISDVVSIHCPLTPETKGLINAKSIASMKRTAFLLNTSRGPIIVEDELATALNEGRIAGAGLDVLSIEPPNKSNPLFGARNCVITPHIAWATVEARRRLMDMAVNNLKQFLSGNPINVVNK